MPRPVPRPPVAGRAEDVVALLPAQEELLRERHRELRHELPVGPDRPSQ